MSTAASPPRCGRCGSLIAGSGPGEGTRLSSSKVRTWPVVLLFAGLGAAGSALVAGLMGAPKPAVHDEFAYLLAADTYASGRVTNPTHPMWEHFESLHVIQRPSYMAKYPPGQGLLLAASQAATGHPLPGVWLGVGLMCGAICWMLLGWLPYRWAIMGSFLVLVQLGLLGYWAQSYWGGALAAAAGALLFGGVRRLLDRGSTEAGLGIKASSGPRPPPGPNVESRQRPWGPGLAIGVGLALLAITRPFESVVVSLPTLLFFLHVLARSGDRRSLLLGGVMPAAVVLALTAGLMAYNNWRVTGDPMRTPYRHYSAERDPPYIFFLWNSATPPQAQEDPRFADMERQWYFERHTRLRTLSGYVAEKRKLVDVAFFLLGPLIVTLAFIPLMGSDPWGRFALVICATAVLANLAIPWTFPHYFAPVVGLAFFIAVSGLREVTRRLDGSAGSRSALGRGFVALILLFSISIFAKRWIQHTFLEPTRFEVQRATVVAELAEREGDQLVLVRYADGHPWHEEWVYNAADIDAAPIVWARYLDEASNRRLLSYFEDRQAWVLDVNGDARLTPLEP